jgi:thymidine kinase
MTVKKADVIIINEGQFFDDIYETTIKLVEKYKKCVYVCGLDSDFKRNKFGRLLDLIPFCDNIFKLQSLCMNCKDGTKALFSKRITNNESQIVIGSDNYIPVCRKCYLMF